MNVYLLIHDDRDYDMGDTYVRGVYADEAAAEAAVVTRTAAGRKSRAYGAHDANCCYVDEREVADAPQIDIQEDPPPPDPNAPKLIPDAFVDALIVGIDATSPWRSRR